MSPTGPIVVGGVGLPWLRDLDFGTQFVRRAERMDWPQGVVFEDLSYSAHRVLHTLQEMAPAKVVLVGAMPRLVDPPGTIRSYPLDLTPPSDEEVAARLGDAVGGTIDLDHTLAVVRYWKGFPADTLVIEVEPGDTSFGLGFSDEVEDAVERVMALLGEELRRPIGDSTPRDATRYGTVEPGTMPTSSGTTTSGTPASGTPASDSVIRHSLIPSSVMTQSVPTQGLPDDVPDSVLGTGTGEGDEANGGREARSRP